MTFEDRVLTFLHEQRAPLASDGIGRQLLCRCPACQRIWFQDGGSVLLDLSPEQIRQLAQRVTADLTRLPALLCRFCLWHNGGGAITIDEYGHGKGFGFSCELLQPLLLHAICTLLSNSWLSQVTLEETLPGIITQPEVLRTVLRQLHHARPHNIEVLPAWMCAVQAAELRPGFGQTGTEHWRWQGMSFELPIAPFRGTATGLLLLALPATEPLHPPSAFEICQLLADLILYRLDTDEA